MQKHILVILFSVFFLGVLHAEISWRLLEDGTLTISGTDMPNYNWNESPWYSKQNLVKKIIIGNGVTNIGDCAFYGCSALTSIVVPNSVTSIGNSAFQSCSNLTSITIPNTVTSIGCQAFFSCSSLTSLNIPNSVTSIGQSAFMNCSALMSVNIPNSVTNIERQTFMNCSSLTSLAIPSSVTNIGYYAFSACSSLKSIIIPASVASIENWAFLGCSGFTSIFVEEENEKYDSRNNCNAIIEKESNILIHGCSNTIIPNSVTAIGNKAFYGSSNLTSITVSNSVTSIGNQSFANCLDLISITISSSVTNIEKFAFANCINIASITSYADTPPNCMGDCFLYVNKSIPVYVPVNSIDAYKKAVEWKDFTNIQAIIVEPASIAFAEASENLIVGMTKKLEATITPEDATTKTITWTSSNTDVATVSSEGIVTGKGAGTSVITATTYNGKTAKCTVTVEQPITTITLNAQTASLWVGKTKALTTTISPTTASNTAVNWSSSNKNVATVSSKGVITAKGKGTCTITCTAADGYGAKTTCEVTVKQQVTEISLSETTVSLWVGDTKTITATASPTTANNTNVTWSSSDKNVATVSSKGVITAKGEGSCSITCTAADGYGTTSICKVNVTQQPTSIEELQIANEESPIYNLNGQRINHSNAQKGIYIINGKKYAK